MLKPLVHLLRKSLLGPVLGGNIRRLMSGRTGALPSLINNTGCPLLMNLVVTLVDYIHNVVGCSSDVTMPPGDS